MSKKSSLEMGQGAKEPAAAPRFLVDRLEYNVKELEQKLAALVDYLDIEFNRVPSMYIATKKEEK